MGDYEKKQRHLEALMNEVLSDDEPFEYSSESYNASDLSSVSSDSDSVVARKRIKVSRTGNTEIFAPSTSQFTAAQSVEQTIDDVIRNMHWTSDSSSDEILGNVNSTDLQWNEITGDNLKHFQFVDNNFGIKQSVIEEMQDKQPADFFFMFVDEALLELMVQETNRYALQKLSKTILPKARIKQWKATNPNEMKIFLGLQIWIGLVQMPKLGCYWSNNVLYSTEVKQVMSRNRFELLLSNWHFTDNEGGNTSERLYKIAPLINHIRKNFQNVITPSNNICVDETLVPFRGRLAFRQYIKNKRHKFGIKLFKLCIEDGYTYDFKIYCGAEKTNTTNSVPTSIVMGLCENLLDCGRTIYVDNYYTSIELAHKLLDRQTHLVGTLRKNRKGIPKDVIQKKLKKGEIIGKESDTGVAVIKWCDKREVLMLSTKHTNKMKSLTARNGNEVQKPEAIIDYNKSKSFIDLSDQVKAYASCLRRSVKWYRKLAVEILLGSAVVNAFIIYKSVTDKNISITEFRENIAKELLGIAQKENNVTSISVKEKHILEEVGTSNRRRCTSCYKKLTEEHNRKYATSKATQTRWKCVQCEKFYCVPCFTIVHNCTL